ANGQSFGADISDDGTRVAFTSEADNLVPGDTNDESDVFLRDLAAGTTQRVSVRNNGEQSSFSSVTSDLDQDGSVVVFQTTADDLIGTNDTNGVADVYARNLATGRTIRVSVGV